MQLRLVIANLPVHLPLLVVGIENPFAKQGMESRGGRIALVIPEVCHQHVANRFRSVGENDSWPSQDTEQLPSFIVLIFISVNETDEAMK